MFRKFSRVLILAAIVITPLSAMAGPWDDFKRNARKLDPTTKNTPASTFVKSFDISCKNSAVRRAGKAIDPNNSRNTVKDCWKESPNEEKVGLSIIAVAAAVGAGYGCGVAGEALAAAGVETSAGLCLPGGLRYLALIDNKNDMDDERQQHDRNQDIYSRVEEPNTSSEPKSSEIVETNSIDLDIEESVQSSNQFDSTNLKLESFVLENNLDKNSEEIKNIPSQDPVAENQGDGLPVITEEDMDGVGTNGPVLEAVDSIVHFCFVKGTLVSAENGLIPIEKIRIGTEVRSCDTDQMNCTLKKVTRLYESYTDSLIKIRVGGSEIVTTPNHPFYVDDYQGYLPAERLQLGHLLVTESKKLDAIEGLQKYYLEKIEKVYNLEVEDLHNYYVRGHNGASNDDSDSCSLGNYLVHNCGGVAGVAIDAGLEFVGGYDRIGLDPSEIPGETIRREQEREEWLPQNIAIAPDPGLFRRGARGLAGRNSNSVGRNRQQAIHEAKDRAGIPRSQQPSRQWEVGNDPKRRGMKNYKYDENPSSHGRYQEFKDANGHKKVVADHVNDPNRATKHAHAGKAKSGQDPRDVDFKDGPRYDAIKKDGDHHIDYD